VGIVKWQTQHFRKPLPQCSKFSLIMVLRKTKDGLFDYSEEDGGTDGASFRELSAAEFERVMACASEVHHLLDRYLPGQSDLGVSPRVLDQLFIKWLGDTSGDKATEQTVAQVLGSTFAFFLRDRKPLVWMVTHSTGQEPTLAVTNRSLGITLHPISSVQKRIEIGSAGFFEPIYAVLEEKLLELLH
jgi:hypothetical protein